MNSATGCAPDLSLAALSGSALSQAYLNKTIQVPVEAADLIGFKAQ